MTECADKSSTTNMKYGYRQLGYGYGYGAIIIIPGNTTAHSLLPHFNNVTTVDNTPLISDCSRQLETTQLILHGEETNRQVHIAIIKYIDLYFCH